jgi:hypothetical protein
MTDSVQLEEGTENQPAPNQKEVDGMESVADNAGGSEPSNKEGARDIDNNNPDPMPHPDTSLEAGHEPSDKEGARPTDKDNSEPMPKLTTESIDDSEEAKLVLEQDTPETALSEDIKSLLESIDLPEEFKTQALGLFEGAVAARVADIKKEMFALNEAKMDEYKSLLAEKVEEKTDAMVAESVAKWLEENKTEVKSNVRTQIAESFMANLVTLLEAHYITVPDGKEDVLESALEEADTLRAQLDEQTKLVESYKAQTVKAEKALVVESLVKSLTDTQAERVRELAESVEFESQDSYTTKMTAIVESITKTKSEKSSEFLTEDVNGEVVITENTETPKAKTIDPFVEHLLKDINRVTGKK